MSARLSPSLDDIRLSYSLLSEAHYWALDDAAFRALMSLISYCASGLVWTYSAPSDGSLPDDDTMLARIARLNIRRWKKVRPDLEEFFDIHGGKWHLNRPWISIEGGGRLAIPLAIQAEVMAREGRRCTYCGDNEGPFHFDHIYPVSKGGTNASSNITLACAPCNLSKRDMTLAEWFTSMREGHR